MLHKGALLPSHASPSSIVPRARSLSPPPRCCSSTERAATRTPTNNGSLTSGVSLHRGSSRVNVTVGPSAADSRGRNRVLQPLSAVAVPLEQTLEDLSLDSAKVLINVTYSTSFGQEVRVVGGGAELGNWDVTKAPVMTWNDGHRWTLTTFLPPGTYPFKLVVAGGSAERWEQGQNRELVVPPPSPELGSAAIVQADCVFDQTANMPCTTKRVTGIGFRSGAAGGNPHMSSSSIGTAGPAAGAGGARLPPAYVPSPNSSSNGNAAAASAAAAAATAARMAAAVGIPTSKVTANAHPAAAAAAGSAAGNGMVRATGGSAVPLDASHAPNPAPLQQQQQQQQAVAAAAAPVGGNGAAPGSEEFAKRMAAIDSQLAQVLSSTGTPLPARKTSNDSSSSSSSGSTLRPPPPPAAAAMAKAFLSSAAQAPASRDAAMAALPAAQRIAATAFLHPAPSAAPSQTYAAPAESAAPPPAASAPTAPAAVPAVPAVPAVLAVPAPAEVAVPEEDVTVPAAEDVAAAAGDHSMASSALAAAAAPAPAEAAASARPQMPRAPTTVDANKVVSNFIKGHLALVEGQAAAILKQNELLERRMAALEQHVESYDNTVLGALTSGLQQADQQAAAAAAAAPQPAASSSSSSSSMFADVHPGPAAEPAAAPRQEQQLDASELVKKFMMNYKAPSSSSSTGGTASGGGSSSSGGGSAYSSGGGSAYSSGGGSAGSGERSSNGDGGVRSRQLVGAAIGSSATAPAFAARPAGAVIAAAAAAAPLDVAVAEPPPAPAAVAVAELPSPAAAVAVAVLDPSPAVADSRGSFSPSASAFVTVEELIDDDEEEEDAADNDDVRGRSTSWAEMGVIFSPMTTATEEEQEEELQMQQMQQPTATDAAAPASSSSSSSSREDDDLVLPVSRHADSNIDPKWQAAHARALAWANSQSPLEEVAIDEVEEEDEEVPWWIRDSLPAVRVTPRPVGGSSSSSGGGGVGLSGSPPSSPLAWTRARVMAPSFAVSPATLAERRLDQEMAASRSWDDDEEPGSYADGDGDADGSMYSRRVVAPGAGFTGTAVTLCIATPSNAAAAATAANASPLVHSLQQHAWKAAKATGQSDQAAAIAATAAAARVAYGFPDSPVAPGRPGSSRRPARDSSAAAAAMSAAVLTRQQVLAVTDVAVRLTAAAESTGTTSLQQGLGLKASMMEPPQAAAGPVVLDVRPETLGPSSLMDQVLQLPSAGQIAASVPASAAASLRSSAQNSWVTTAEELASDQGEQGDDEASDDELEQLAVLQEENKILSELAGIHSKMSSLQARAMILEHEAKQTLAGQQQQQQTPADDDDGNGGEGAEDAAEAMRVGGVMGLALVSKVRRNHADGVTKNEDVAAVRKLVEAMQLRMQAALLQTEAAAKREALMVERSSQRRQRRPEQQASDTQPAAAEDAVSTGGGSAGLEQQVQRELQAACVVNHGSSSEERELASANVRGTLSAQPAAVAVDASAIAAAAAAVAAGAAPAEWEREAMCTVTAVAGVMSEDEVDNHKGRTGPGRHSSRGGSSSAPSSVTAANGSANPNAAAVAAATAVASSSFALQQDLHIMKKKIAVLQSKVASRRAQVALLHADEAGTPSSSAASGHAAAEGSKGASSSASRLSISPGMLASAAAAAAAATAVAAVSSAPAAAAPETLLAAQPAAAMTAATATMTSSDGRPAPAAQGVFSTKPAGFARRTSTGPAAAAHDPAAPAAAAAGAVIGVAAAAAASREDPDSSGNGTNSWTAPVYNSPALAATEPASDAASSRPALAALEARAAAAVAAREQLSHLYKEVQSSLAVLSPDSGSTGAVSAAGHDVRVKGAAQAVATLTDWEAKAASAKQQLINLERQAAEALAELEEHQAHTARVKQRQIRQRQSLQPAWKRQQELLAAIEAAGNGDRGYVWPVAGAAGAALAAQAVEMNQMTCVLGSCVPDPAAAAVAGVVAVENAVQHAGQVLHNLHL